MVRRLVSFVQRVVWCERVHDMHESLDRPHIDLLVALQETGQLGKAAATLHLSPSAASHRLKEAERRVGVSLTVVQGRSIELTAAGRHLAEIGGAANQALRSAEETARWMSSADRPAVRIAMDFYDTAPWFEQLIGSSELPCDVDFIRIGFSDVASAVQGRRADLGIVVSPPRSISGEDRSAEVLVDELVAVVRADHPAAQRGELDPRDIAAATYLTAGDRPAHGFEHHEFFEPAGVRPLRLRKVESLAMILRLMRTFGGVTVQPALAVKAAPLDGLAVVPLMDAHIPVMWTAVLRHDASENELAMRRTVQAIARRESFGPGPGSMPVWAGA